jgi:solute:Na+ symporter, SSS family
MDVEKRNREIGEWQKNPVGVEPESINPGEVSTQSYTQVSRSVFWGKGIKLDENGRKFGSGMLSLELVFLDKTGFDLSRNPYALNETIRILIRTIVPFLILIVVSLLTRRDDKALLDRFFVKMKTPVDTDPDEDLRQLELSYSDPHRFDHTNLFGPGSDWEFNKWTRTDAVGFLISCAMAIGVIRPWVTGS